jgi:hypothetical protein
VSIFPVADAETAFFIETSLHNQFIAHRLAGSEWFRFDGRCLVDVIERARDYAQELAEMTSVEQRFSCVVDLHPARHALAEERERFEGVKRNVLMPKAEQRRRMSELRALGRMAAIRSVLDDVPSLFVPKLIRLNSRFDVKRFSEAYPEIASRFRQPARRSFRWAYRAPPVRRSVLDILPRAEACAKRLLMGHVDIESEELVEQVRTHLVGFDDVKILHELHGLMRSVALRSVSERMEMSWFKSRVADSEGIEGVCRGGFLSPKVDGKSLASHVMREDRQLFDQYQTPEQLILRVQFPDGGSETEAHVSAEDFQAEDDE